MKPFSLFLMVVGAVIAILAAPDMARVNDVGSAWAAFAAGLGLFLLIGGIVVFAVASKRR